MQNKRLTTGGRARAGSFLAGNTALVILLVFVLIGALINGHFLTMKNLSAIISQYAIIGLFALGQMLVMVTGGIDLSQGSLVGLSSVLCAIFLGSMDVAPAVLLTVLAISLFGVISGLLISNTTMPPFLVTLGMMGVCRGLAKYVSNQGPISAANPAFLRLSAANVWGVPIYAFIWLALAGIVAVCLIKTRAGQYVYAVGSNEKNAYLSGVNVRKTKLMVYIVSALFSAVAGVFWASRLASGSPLGGEGYEMESIACAVVGGVSFAGGVGTVRGVVVGTLLFGVINSILNLAGISPYLQGALKGAFILLAILLNDAKALKKRKG